MQLERSLASAKLGPETPLVPKLRLRNSAERLGFPLDARLLIVHADDLALAHSQDMASFEAMNQGVVSSASIMVPCPWVTEAVDYAKVHPDADLGVHLTLTSEWKTYRWGPVAPREQVPSLLDPQGFFHSKAAVAGRLITAKDAACEMRAQIEMALKMGLHPTHLDSHMGVLFERPDLVAALVEVSHEYHLPFLTLRYPDSPPELFAPIDADDELIDHIFVADSAIKADDWLGFYTNLVQTLPPGISEVMVHLAFDNSEMQAITVDHPNFGSAWRQRDFNVLTSVEFRRALKENDVNLITWRDLGRLLPN